MKKLLALLLALLLPAGVLAEAGVTEDSDIVPNDTSYQQLKVPAGEMQAFCLEIAVTANEESLAALLQPSMQMSDAATAAKAIAKLLNGFGMKLVAQGDNISFDLLLKNASLMDFNGYMTADGQQVIVTSSMMPGYGLVQHADDDKTDAALTDKLLEELTHLLADMASDAMPLLQEIDVERTRGSFEGDAYTGGVWCTTVRLDDRQIAEFLRALLTDDVQEAVTAFLTLSGLGTAETVRQLVARHEDVALANEYHYILRFVEDANGEPVGLSATVMRGEEQLSTFSLGIADDTLRIVTGVGGVQENYWYDHLILFEKPEVHTVPGDDVIVVLEGAEGLEMSDVEIVYGDVEDRDGFVIRGSCIEFIGDKESSFSYALATADESLVWCDWMLDVKQDGARIEWQYAEESGVAPAVLKEGMPASVNIQAKGLVDDEMTGSIVYTVDGVECLSVSATFKPCAPIPPMSDDLVLVDVESGDHEQQLLAIEAENTLIDALSQKMITLMPVELILLLVQLGL